MGGNSEGDDGSTVDIEAVDYGGGDGVDGDGSTDRMVVITVRGWWWVVVVMGRMVAIAAAVGGGNDGDGRSDGGGEGVREARMGAWEWSVWRQWSETRVWSDWECLYCGTDCASGHGERRPYCGSCFVCVCMCMGEGGRGRRGTRMKVAVVRRGGGRWRHKA